MGCQHPASGPRPRKEERCRRARLQPCAAPPTCAAAPQLRPATPAIATVTHAAAPRGREGGTHARTKPNLQVVHRRGLPPAPLGRAGPWPRHCRQPATLHPPPPFLFLCPLQLTHLRTCTDFARPASSKPASSIIQQQQGKGPPPPPPPTLTHTNTHARTHARPSSPPPAPHAPRHAPAVRSGAPKTSLGIVPRP